MARRPPGRGRSPVECCPRKHCLRSKWQEVVGIEVAAVTVRRYSTAGRGSTVVRRPFVRSCACMCFIENSHHGEDGNDKSIYTSEYRERKKPAPIRMENGTVCMHTRGASDFSSSTVAALTDCADRSTSEKAPATVPDWSQKQQ